MGRVGWLVVCWVIGWLGSYLFINWYYKGKLTEEDHDVYRQLERFNRQCK